MKKRVIIILFVLTLIIEIGVCSILFTKIDSVKQDTIKINECVKSVEENYYDSSKYYKKLDYTIIDNNGNLVYKTNKSKTNSLNDAIKNNDIILDVKVNNQVVGKILISNNTGELIDKYRNYLRISIIIMSLIQVLLIVFYLIYLDRNIIRPFKKLNGFAERVAAGNLDLPLYMDKNHAFGEFTEAFDLMRSELKKARISEKKAIEEKKEIVAKLSHDIKTPVASIKSTSEIGYEKTKEESSKNYFNLINTKTDQIKLLVDNLFTSSVNEITEINVNPSNYSSSVLNELIKNSDYLEKLNKYSIPECNIYIDKVRMQQTLDNIINNSYKYATTKIDIDIKKTKEYLVLEFRDYGPGVDELDLPLLKEKFIRGRNVKDQDGAGLGLHLANYFMDKMNGKLELSNSNPGFVATIYIRII